MTSHRYLKRIDIENVEIEYHDVLIIGSGIAGVYTSLEISEEYDIAILTKESIEISNSVLAQGGIAVSLDKKDSPELHFKDTLYAGAGLCDDEAVWVLVNKAAQNIESLCKYGVNFDKKNSSELSLTREAAHSMNRIIHAGDTTGKEVCDKLISVVKAKNNVTIKERTFAIDLITEDNECKGIYAYEEDTKTFKVYLSNIVICATGGFGQLYSSTTNPEVATGDGVCLAYRAGAQLMDLEFIQFHPTVLYHQDNKNFLISEAVRGEGALLKNINGERFMPKYHELNELAPRDVVSRAIFEEMKNTNSKNVFLDITFKSEEYLKKRFPNIYKTCLGYGIDISKDFIPVSPAEHYCMGGVRTDVFGRTKIKGFYACGEVACNGIHGANRLASNSLLEGLVFGHIIGAEIETIIKECKPKLDKIIDNFKSNEIEIAFSRKEVKEAVQKLMTDYVGIIRNKEGLLYVRAQICAFSEKIENLRNQEPEDFELQNIILLSRLVIEAALEREESRGAHFRSDFNKIDNINWRKNIIKSIEVGEVG